MSHDTDAIDGAILSELDRALVLLDRKIADDSRDAACRLSLITRVDLLSRARRVHLTAPELSARQKYEVLAARIRDVFAAWGDVPPGFLRFYVPEEIYERLNPIYVIAIKRAAAME